MKKLTQKCFMALLTLAMAFSLFAGLTGFKVQADAGVADNTPFYNDPYNPNNGATVKNADGSYSIYQSTGGGGTRLFYGDYLSGSHENQYLVDLTDFTMEFSVERLGAGQTIEIGFLTPVSLGSYPMAPHGQGVSINLIDGNGAPWGHEANSDFNPIITAFNTDGVETQGSYDWPWHVYSNTSVRPSYLGKKMTLHIFVSEGVMNFDITWATDEVNNGNASNFSGMINVDKLPLDYTKAHMIITNDSNSGADMTIYNISETNTNAYYESVGGKLNNSVKAIAEYVSAVKAFDVNNVTGEQIKNYYYTKNNFDNFNTAILRAEDIAEYNATKALTTEGFDAVALANADKAFEGYTANSEITDYADALKVYYYYFAFADQLSAYAEVVANIRDAIATQDFGQLAVINEMNAIMTEYAEFDASKFYIAKARYDAVTVSYNGLSMFAKDLASNKFAELNTWGATWTNAYYVTTGSYFSTVYGYNPEDGTKWENPAHASRNEDGTTTIALPDHFGCRIAYGSDVDMETGYWTDYKVNISDFSVAFSIDQIANSGRFAVNFMANRAAVSYGTETTPGLAIIFRSDWGSSGNLNVSLQSIAGKNGNNYLNIDAWTNKVPEVSGYSEIGTISSSTGRYDQDVVIKFVATEDGYKLTVSIGSSTATATLTKAFMDEMFVQDGEAVDYSSLVMGFSIGEGGTAFGGGMDTVLTVKNVNDDYVRGVAQIKNEISVFNNTVKSLSNKDEYAIEEITSYNRNKANIYSAVAVMRTYEKAECEKLLESITNEMLSAIDAKAIAYVSTKLEGLTVTVENFNQAKNTLKEIAEYYEVLSDEQKALYADYTTKYEGAMADVQGCTEAKAVIEAIETLVAKILLPSTAEAITVERNAVAEQYQALATKYAAMVTNYAEFEAYSAKLDSYDPVTSVKNAIEKLATDYATVSNANLDTAKQAVADVKAAYEQLLDAQKTEIDNYSKIAEVEATIVAFEQYIADYAVASSVITAIANANTAYETVTADNYDAMVTEIAALNTAYGDLTDAQKALVDNYALIADMQAKIDAYNVDVQDTTVANAVIEMINAIGEVALTTECKAKIDEARTAYEALNEQAKAKVTNLETLTSAETAYAALENAQSSTESSSDSKPAQTGCAGSVSASATMAIVTLIAGAFAMLTKKKD